ncbi:hypothetical protein Taro_006838, partial [Colocasia esculenta]|nr:hypothetical protein [Colocasia esculenta]
MGSPGSFENSSLRRSASELCLLPGRPTSWELCEHRGSEQRRRQGLQRQERMTVVASTIVYEVLGRRVQDVDKPIVDYIINVLADEDFDFGIEGEGAFEALGELLVEAGCVGDYAECRSACSEISKKFGKHGVKPKQTVRSLVTPVRMFDGMDEEPVPKKQPDVLEGPVLSERDRLKLERRKRKDERQRE